MMVAAAMLGWTLGYVLAHATRTVEGAALYVPVPRRLRRFVER
jgi:hypothetical protein